MLSAAGQKQFKILILFGLDCEFEMLPTVWSYLKKFDICYLLECLSGIKMESLGMIGLKGLLDKLVVYYCGLSRPLGSWLAIVL